jgi:hypothetical protein
LDIFVNQRALLINWGAANWDVSLKQEDCASFTLQRIASERMAVYERRKHHRDMKVGFIDPLIQSIGRTMDQLRLQ